MADNREDALGVASCVRSLNGTKHAAHTHGPSHPDSGLPIWWCDGEPLPDKTRRGHDGSMKGAPRDFATVAEAGAAAQPKGSQ